MDSFFFFFFGCLGSLLWCVGFSLWWLLLLRSTGSRHAGFSSCGSWALEHRLSSCGAQTQLLHGMWDLPGPGLEPVSPALAAGFLTTAPPGKSPNVFLLNIFPLLIPKDHTIGLFFCLFVFGHTTWLVGS